MQAERINQANVNVLPISDNQVPKNNSHQEPEYERNPKNNQNYLQNLQNESFEDHKHSSVTTSKMDSSSMVSNIPSLLEISTSKPSKANIEPSIDDELVMLDPCKFYKIHSILQGLN